MGGTRVGPQATREYLAQMRERYQRADRAAKGRLLDEVCAVTGYHRKAVIRLLRRATPARRGRRRGRPVRYGPELVAALRRQRHGKISGTWVLRCRLPCAIVKGVQAARQSRAMSQRLSLR